VSPPGRPKGETRSAQHEGTPASESTPPVIHLVDDDASLRTALGRLLVLAGYEVRHYRSAGDYLLAEPDDAPGCLLLDVRMPGMTGLELQALMAREGYQLPVIIITGHGDVAMAVKAMKSGAVDFIEKPFHDEDLLRSIRHALALDQRQRASQGSRTEIASRRADLTPREHEIMVMVTEGRSNKEMALALGVSTKTVEAHRARVMEKMRAESLAELVRMAMVVGGEGAP
jgi:FixJ family two-component response regulator